MLSRLVLAITAVVFVVAGPPAYAKGPSRKECGRACDTGISACMSSCGDFGTPENFHRTCKKAIIKGCKREGTEFCRQLLAPIPTTTTTTTTTPGATTTTTLMRFVDNGDGTITDNQTGLMWEKKSNDGGIHDVDNQYTWSKSSRSTNPDGTAYTVFLKTLNGGSGFAAHKDWRLPEVDKDGGSEELDSLLDLSQGGAPYVFDEFKSPCPPGCSVSTCSCTAADVCWSSITYAFPGDLADAWAVNFGDTYTITDGKDVPLHVRAVRGGSGTTTTTTTTPGSTTTTLPRFVDNGDGTITDYQTGLMWEKKSDDNSIHDVDKLHTWSQPVPSTGPNGTAYTVFLTTLNSGSGFAGHKDWRLPEVDKDGGSEELDSLLDLGQGGAPYIFDEFNSSCTPACSVSTCSCTAPDFYWSSTTYVFPGDSLDAWAVNFGDTYTIPYGKEDPLYVRAVRGPD